MDYEEKVAFLRKYRDSLRREQMLAEELAELRSRAECLTKVINGMPGAPSDGSDRPRAVENIMELETIIEVHVNECNEKLKSIIKTIDRVQNNRFREILRRRYILGQTWEEIAEKMYMSDRWCKKLHKDAITELTI